MSPPTTDQPGADVTAIAVPATASRNTAHRPAPTVHPPGDSDWDGHRLAWSARSTSAIAVVTAEAAADVVDRVRLRHRRRPRRRRPAVGSRCHHHDHRHRPHPHPGPAGDHRPRREPHGAGRRRGQVGRTARAHRTARADRPRGQQLRPVRRRLQRQRRPELVRPRPRPGRAQHPRRRTRGRHRHAPPRHRRQRPGSVLGGPRRRRRFGIVTAMEIDLFPAPHVYGGRLLWPIEMAYPVLKAFQQITATAPDELTPVGAPAPLPAVAGVARVPRGGSFVSVDATSPRLGGRAEALIAALRSIPAMSPRRHGDGTGRPARRHLRRTGRPDARRPSSSSLMTDSGTGVDALLAEVGQQAPSRRCSSSRSATSAGALSRCVGRQARPGRSPSRPAVRPRTSRCSRNWLRRRRCPSLDSRSHSTATCPTGRSSPFSVQGRRHVQRFSARRSSGCRTYKRAVDPTAHPQRPSGSIR